MWWELVVFAACGVFSVLMAVVGTLIAVGLGRRYHLRWSSSTGTGRAVDWPFRTYLIAVAAAWISLGLLVVMVAGRPPLDDAGQFGGEFASLFCLLSLIASAVLTVREINTGGTNLTASDGTDSRKVLLRSQCILLPGAAAAFLFALYVASQPMIR